MEEINLWSCRQQLLWKAWGVNGCVYSTCIFTLDTCVRFFPLVWYGVGIPLPKILLNLSLFPLHKKWHTEKDVDDPLDLKIPHKKFGDPRPFPVGGVLTHIYTKELAPL